MPTFIARAARSHLTGPFMDSNPLVALDHAIIPPMDVSLGIRRGT